VKLLDLTGQRFGRLSVVRRAENQGVKPAWLCLCDCGKEAVVKAMQLRAGDTKSCGCLRDESMADLIQKRTIHGHNRKGARTRIYRIWAGMLSRCHSPTCKDYKFYGAKGIVVCDRWHTFENFLADMGEPEKGMTIERIKSSENYEPGNCEWLSHSENCRRAAISRRAKRLTFAEAA
jgi:hypothetical protein